MKRYWFIFNDCDDFNILNLGCGITAHNKEDALSIINNIVFPIYGELEISNIIEDIDINILDKGHILPNIGNVISRGVWFPLI